MGANPTQALAVLVFLTGSILFVAGLFFGGSVLLMLLALVAIATSVALFLKAKPLENAGE
jgi:membrane-bound ClpP family serine protease